MLTPTPASPQTRVPTYSAITGVWRGGTPGALSSTWVLGFLSCLRVSGFGLRISKSARILWKGQGVISSPSRCID
ncbi:hypothetical protein BDZ94DRAFT_1278707 [Collybia nuda]|uniref:Uncharacterized protein n=1 Tax=Collybia nuda TaxID=64659 RepID=A0A9P6CBL0_9AGAR|nr:hypothetical protein BDZ94DRAFT_1278707 [Collybia nuda]